jgi:hypothetical protein
MWDKLFSLCDVDKLFILCDVDKLFYPYLSMSCGQVVYFLLLICSMSCKPEWVLKHRTDLEHHFSLWAEARLSESGRATRGYRWPNGPGTMGRPENGPKKPGTRTTRHEGGSASGWPGPMVRPGLGHTLGTVARHGARHDFWASPMSAR